MGSVNLTTLIRVSLAEVQGKSGQIADGLHVLEEAITLVETIEERFYETALHRLQGQILLQKSPDNATEAESCFQKAISITPSQCAKSWELRVATSLDRLWQRQGNGLRINTRA
jgi:predicted negative regulator of RcsB-dependent stress response